MNRNRTFYGDRHSE